MVEIKTGKDSLTFPEAGLRIVRALLGYDEFKGGVAATLTLYRNYARGPQKLAADGPEFDGQRGPSERWKALSDVPLRLICGDRLEEIPGIASLGLVRTDALRAFGLELPARPVQTSAPAPAAPELKRTKEPHDDWTDADYAELLRQHESLTTGPGKILAKTAWAMLGEAWGYKVNSIKKYLQTARELKG